MPKVSIDYLLPGNTVMHSHDASDIIGGGVSGPAGGDLGGTYPNPTVTFSHDTLHVLKAGDTMTGPLVIDGSSDTVQSIVQANGTQTANLQEWQDSSGTAMTRITSNGVFDSGDSSEYIRIGRANPTPFKMIGGFTGDAMATFTGTRYAFTSAGIVNIFQAAGTIIPVSPATVVWFAGYDATVQNSGDSNVDYLFGAHFAVNNQSGSATNIYGLMAEIGVNGSSTAGTAYGVHVDVTKAGGATLTNAYGLHVGDITTATNNYAVYTGRGDVRLMSNVADKLGFHGATPIAQQTVTGSRGGNAALASVLTALANLGLIVDSSS